MPLRVLCHGRAWPGPGATVSQPSTVSIPCAPSHCRKSLPHICLNYNQGTENAKAEMDLLLPPILTILKMKGSEIPLLFSMEKFTEPAEVQHIRLMSNDSRT